MRFVLAALMTVLATQSSATARPTNASTVLMDASGKAVGRAMLIATPRGLHVIVSAMGLPPGVHGVHVHAVGICAAPDFASAGPHWNPMARQHGSANPQGMHMGDLPNLVVDPNGNGTLDGLIQGATLTDGANPLLDADGAAIVVHAAPDDYKTDPSGASGSRTACGVLQAS